MGRQAVALAVQFVFFLMFLLTGALVIVSSSGLGQEIATAFQILENSYQEGPRRSSQRNFLKLLAKIICLSLKPGYLCPFLPQHKEER